MEAKPQEFAPVTKVRFFGDARQAYGRSALLLSGGASLGTPILVWIVRFGFGLICDVTIYTTKYLDVLCSFEVLGVAHLIQCPALQQQQMFWLGFRDFLIL